MAKLTYLILGKEKPSSRKRVLDSVGYLRSAGHEVRVVKVPKDLPGCLALIPALRSSDIVIIQKKLFNAAQLSLIRAFSKKLVFDFDDAVMFIEIERNEPVTGKFFSRFANTAKKADAVIAGNESLAEYARSAGAKTFILPTPVDTDFITPANRQGGGKVVIGWMGTKGNLAHLKAVAPPVARVIEICPQAVLRVVSNSYPALDGFDFEYKEWNADEELADLRSFDIGIMPLADNIWTRGKGGFKLLTYMAAGVASVASPVGINNEIIRHGENGLLAGTEDDWEKALFALVSKPELREKLGKAGRDTAVGEYSLSGYNRRLAEILAGI
ncbi:MAG TPA: glycosyltransferase family 4 protein [Nitrospirota bacterium]